MKKFALIFILLMLPLVSCDNWFTSETPIEPDKTVYAYEGTFLSDSQKDLTGYRWEFEFLGACNDLDKDKLPSDQVMRISMDCLPTVPHTVRLYTAIYNPNEPGAYATFSNISWQASPDGTLYKFTFHVK